MATVLDHYVTSFNYAQTNFAAVWLRPKWMLFTDGAVTDAQYGGLNMVTGGGYSRSDSPLGNWMLAYRSVFIGSSQGARPANPYASAAGPFNPDTAKLGLNCDNKNTVNYCLSADAGISMQIGPFPGQRMFSLYDGPAFQKSNAYLDIYPTDMSGGGWMYLSKAEGVPKDKSNQCYLPNAAIAWKQPNGFYYPPAFHSQNLMFRNSNIRHFLIEPLFQENRFPFKGFIADAGKISGRYCKNTSTIFNSFTDIDRQTVLNDGVPDVQSMPGGDGSLTGLVATEQQPTKTNARETISVNEDSFFNAPVERVECASDRHPSDKNGIGPPGTAKVSPYEYVTTAIMAKCVIGQYSCPAPGDPNRMCNRECNDDNPNGIAYWTRESGNGGTFGVPLYREYLTNAEWSMTPRPKPFIMMMGQGSGQRSTLTLNHGRYYLDTSYNCNNQVLMYDGKNDYGGCLTPGGVPGHGVSVFLKDQEYYVYFIYGRASTKLTFDIYLGPNDETRNDPAEKVRPIRPIFNTIQPEPFREELKEADWLGKKYSYDADNKKGVLTITVDLSKSPIASELDADFKLACAPTTYCEVKGEGDRKTCGCKDSNNESCNEACSWGPKDPDCPENGCYGFSFTMPSDWQAPAQPVPFTDAMQFTDDPDGYFNASNVLFKALTTNRLKEFGQDSQCDYRGK